MVNTQGDTRQAMGSQANVTGAVPTQWTFRDIDRDSNLELSDREFSRVSRDVYGRWDANRDRRVTQNEFNRGWRNWGIGDRQVSYGMFDANNDGILDANEFRTGFDRLSYYDRWDADRDGLLAQNEFNTGMYDVWDADSDGVLAQNEFNELTNRTWF
jgi:hypothetical protein